LPPYQRLINSQNGQKHRVEAGMREISRAPCPNLPFFGFFGFFEFFRVFAGPPQKGVGFQPGPPKGRRLFKTDPIFCLFNLKTDPEPTVHNGKAFNEEKLK
jgi:hypothetical protein